MNLDTWSTITMLLTLAGAIVASRAISTSRTPQGAVGWAVFLLTMPMLAIPSYFVFGYMKFDRFAKARKASERQTRPADRAESHPPDPDCAKRLELFARLGQAESVGGSGIDFLIDGEETFDAILEAVAEAKEYVLVQYYTIRDDKLGQRVKKALIAKAEEGVTVHLLYDQMGSLLLPRRYLNELSQAGVDVQGQSGPRRVLGRLGLNFRNHRKTVIVDGRVAFTGGLNVGDEYMGRHPALGNWRDTHARITGPIVSQLQGFYVQDWFWATQNDLNNELHWVPGNDPRDMSGLILSPAPTDHIEKGSLYFCGLLHLAKKRIWIATPYFVPDMDVLTALKLAALRGVEVRIIVPHRADKWMPWFAAWAYFDEVRDAGCRVWRYGDGFMHQKVVLVDDDLISVGTINLDIRSSILNFEETAILCSREAAKEVEDFLREDFSKSKELTTHIGRQKLLVRAIAPIARLLAPIL